jgi:hypothetical protein
MKYAEAADRTSAFLSKLHLAPRQSAKQLTLWPLLHADPEAGTSGRVPYISLADALGVGQASVEEVGSGSVPHVAVRNRGEIPVLVLFGEEIVGAKQNRIANASFLVPPQQRVVLDVSCVEQGRWSPGTDELFAASDHVVSARMRAGIAEDVASARARGKRFRADQGAVWRDVGERLSRSGVSSGSHAYAAYARSRRSEHESLAGSFPWVPRQVGFVASIHDAIVGAEVVGDPRIYARVHDRLLRAYTIDAVDGPARPAAPDATPVFDSPEGFLAAVADVPKRGGASLGLGTDLRFASDGLSGCALVWHEPVHLTAFSGTHGRREAGLRRARDRQGLLARLWRSWR